LIVKNFSLPLTFSLSSPWTYLTDLPEEREKKKMLFIEKKEGAGQLSANSKGCIG
jgi:hypothetical protein